MTKRRSRLFISVITATIILLSQVALAGYACQFGAPTAKSMGAMADCMTKQTPAPCKAHCEKDSQIGVSSVSLAAPTFSHLIWADLSISSLSSPQHANMELYAALEPPIIFSSPPLRIQYQVFRI